MNEQTTYTFNGEENHFAFGRYVIGNHYLCIKDDSLLDTQILLIDEDGVKNWEHVTNFTCHMSPYLITVDYDIVINESYKIPYQVKMVWYEERGLDELVVFINQKSKYPLEVKKVTRE